MKHSNAPSHTWLAGNRVMRGLAYAFIFSVLLVGISVWTVRYSVERDCQNYYKRDILVFSSWVHIESGSTKKDCPNPYK